jgi:hypothetical protein
MVLLVNRNLTNDTLNNSRLRLQPRAKSFHEKAGECQDFCFIFSLFFSFCFIYFFFFTIISIEPSRLCRHPSIRTLY